MPPGFLLSVQPVNNRDVHGIRKSFMTQSGGAIRNLSVMRDLHENVPYLAADAGRLSNILSSLKA